MRKLAETIRARSEALARTYSRRLKAIAGYDQLTPAQRLNIARAALHIVTAYVDNQDDAAFVQAIQTLIETRVKEGWPVESLLPALLVLEETVIPLATSATAARLLWTAFVKAHGVVSTSALSSLCESERIYRQMAEEAGDIIYISDPRGYFTYVNPACERLIGCPASEIIGRHFSELIAPEWRERVVEFYGRQFRERLAETRLEVPVLRADGTVRWVEQKVILMSKGDWVTGFQTIGRDVTERKLLEDALRESESKFRQMVDRALVGIFRTSTATGEIIEANQAVLRLLRHESLEAANRFGLYNMYVDLADRQRLLQLVQQGPVTGFETRFRRGDGEIVDISVGARLIRDEAGNPLYLEGTLEDISERKRLEGRVRELLELRGRQVQTSTEVAQEIAAAPALEELFRRVVTLIKERFGYYHAQIFRYEPALDAVVLVASYGEAGERLLARGHRLPMGRGVVGTAAATGRPILATDVAQDKDWQPNPDLPDTKGELAVPIRLRDRVLGILDVQSDQAGALTEDDQLLLEGLCGQIAVAIESTRLRQEMDERLAELSALYRAASREGWESFRGQAELPTSYLFDRVDVHPAEEWTPEVGRAVEQGALVPPGPDGKAAVAPLAVHGEIIGALGVYEDPQRPLSAEDLEIVGAISEQLALALESARLAEQTRTALDESQALYQAGMAINAAQGYEEILEALRRHTVLGQADRLASINLFDVLWTEGQELQFVEVPARWTPLPADRFSPRYALAQFPELRALRPDVPLVIQDIAQTDRLQGAAQQLYREAFGGRGVLIVPLVVGGQVIGFVDGVFSQPARFTEADVRRLTAVASQAATAIQSIRQLEVARQRARQEQMLREVTAVVTASQDLPADLPTVGQRLRELVDLDGLVLITRAPGEDDLAVVAVETVADRPALPIQPGSRLPVEGTAYGWVVSHHQPRLEADLRDPATELFMDSMPLVSQGLVSRLILPVAIGRQTVGALALLSAHAGAFTGEHIPLLQPVAEQMALALERARLLREMQAALDEVEATHRSYLRGQWEEYLSRRKELQLRGLMFEQSAVTAVPDLWRPEIARVLEEKGPVVVSGDGGTARTGLAIPIILRGQVIGVLGVEDPEGVRQWSEQDLTLVQAIGQQLGLALENTRLLEETRRRAERDRLIAEITARVRASSEIETILRTAVQQLGVALGTDRAFVRLSAAATAASERTE